MYMTIDNLLLYLLLVSAFAALAAYVTVRGYNKLFMLTIGYDVPRNVDWAMFFILWSLYTIGMFWLALY